MAENLFVRSAVQKFLDRKRLTVADLVRRMQEGGFRFDKKTIYRLASDKPVRHLNLRAVAAISRVLELSDPGKLIIWSTTPRLQRIDATTQEKLDELMGKNTEGTLNATERRELNKLGHLVERLSLENARLLASHGSPTNAAIKKRALAAPQATRRRTAPLKESRAEAAVG